MNKKSLVNIVLKRNSQKPNPSTLKMLRYVAVEVLFRLSMMFLKTNETVLLETSRRYGISDEHSVKMERLLLLMIPPPSEPSSHKQEFKHLELWLGHDMFVTSIMHSSKTAKNKPQYSKVIPKLQWTEFTAEQFSMGRVVPNLDSFLYAPTYREDETRTISSPMKPKRQKTESPKKRKGNTRTSKETTGKSFGISCLLCKFI
jgi:hypothetical protein